MRIFFDTEFTGLTPDAKLISIGLVDESGSHEFYAELSDTYCPEDCSEFCRREVLPHLEGEVLQMSQSRLRLALTAWLQARGPDVVLVCDSPRDVSQLRILLPNGLPANANFYVLGRVGNLKRRIFIFGRRIHRQRGLRVHHALDDAKVTRLILTR